MIKNLNLRPQNRNETVFRARISLLTKDTGQPPCQVPFEELSPRINTYKQRFKSEKQTAIGYLAKSIAHELGNPLSILSSTVQRIQDSNAYPTDTHLHDACDTVKACLKRMEDLLRHLSNAGGISHELSEEVDMEDILHESLKHFQPECEGLNIRIFRAGDGYFGKCHLKPRKVRQVLFNLLQNAVEAIPNRGEISVDSCNCLLDGQKGISLAVFDNGCGILASDQRKIFKPFFSTKPGKIGLGLTFCQRVMEEHDGEITVESSLGQGSLFTVTFPVNRRGD